MGAISCWRFCTSHTGRVAIHHPSTSTVTSYLRCKYPIVVSRRLNGQAENLQTTCLAAAISNSICLPTDERCICTDEQLNEAVAICVAATCTTREALSTHEPNSQTTPGPMLTLNNSDEEYYRDAVRYARSARPNIYTLFRRIPRPGCNRNVHESICQIYDLGVLLVGRSIHIFGLHRASNNFQITTSPCCGYPSVVYENPPLAETPTFGPGTLLISALAVRPTQPRVLLVWTQLSPRLSCISVANLLFQLPHSVRAKIFGKFLLTTSQKIFR